MIEKQIVQELSERGYDPVGVETFLWELKGMGFEFSRTTKPDVVDRFVLRYSNEDNTVSIIDTSLDRVVFSGDSNEYKEYAEQETRRRNRRHWQDGND